MEAEKIDTIGMAEFLKGNQPDKQVSACENKEVSSFCGECVPFDCTKDNYNRSNVFMDRLGIFWICSRPFWCDHAIVEGDRIHSCRVRSRQIRDEERGRPDVTG